MARIGTTHVVAGAGILAAAGIAYLATRSAGPVPMPAFTELRQGPLMEHLVTREQLTAAPVFMACHYPPRVAPGISQIVQHGYSPLWQVPDPSAAALPSEEMW